MTFAQRRRLVRFLWLFCQNASLPFFLGFVFSLLVWTHTLISTFETVETAGFGLCVVKHEGQGGVKI